MKQERERAEYRREGGKKKRKKKRERILRKKEQVGEKDLQEKGQ